jgi:DNA adenine methylase
MGTEQLVESANQTLAKSKQLVKPFLKWAGGKRQLVPTITANYLPKVYNTYYEPFLGAGALFLELQPHQAIVNDSNSELINCYEVIRDSVEELIEYLSQHKNQADYYYEIRAWDRTQEFKERTPIERASRIMFLNRTCYNGLFRVNSQGQFNVPFGSYRNPNIVNETTLRAVSQYLNRSNLKILNDDFQVAVKTAKPGDFIYFDPPYDPVSETASFTSYAANGFNKDEQIRLKLTVDALSDRGCYVLLSNAYTSFIVELYQSYRIEKVAAARSINSNGLKRGKIDEVLVMNY